MMGGMLDVRCERRIVAGWAFVTYMTDRRLWVVGKNQAGAGQISITLLAPIPSTDALFVAETGRGWRASRPCTLQDSAPVASDVQLISLYGVVRVDFGGSSLDRPG
jgi:hypothetical protein